MHGTKLGDSTFYIILHNSSKCDDRKTILDSPAQRVKVTLPVGVVLWEPSLNEP